MQAIAYWEFQARFARTREERIYALTMAQKARLALWRDNNAAYLS